MSPTLLARLARITRQIAAADQAAHRAFPDLGPREPITTYYRAAELVALNLTIWTR
jgi:hypothetical protein